MWLPIVLHNATKIGETFQDLIVLATCMHNPYFFYPASFQAPVFWSWFWRPEVAGALYLFCSSSIAITRTLRDWAIITASSAKIVVHVSSQETSYPTWQSLILVLISTKPGTATLWYFPVLKSTDSKTLLDLLHSPVHSFVVWRVFGIWIQRENQYMYIHEQMLSFSSIRWNTVWIHPNLLELTCSSSVASCLWSVAVYYHGLLE